MAGARSYPAAALLSDGNALAAGGSGPDSWLGTAELYDPLRGTWRATGQMIEAHVPGGIATVLRDGAVLVAGGIGGSGLATAELYDPTSGLWSAAGDIGEVIAGRDHVEIPETFTLLSDGRVLVAGVRTRPYEPRGTGPFDFTENPSAVVMLFDYRAGS
jgi:hypothetical protein